VWVDRLQEDTLGLIWLLPWRRAPGGKTTILPPKATHNRGLFTVTPIYSVHNRELQVVEFFDLYLVLYLWYMKQDLAVETRS
jgi:hypothetical protein